MIDVAAVFAATQDDDPTRLLAALPSGASPFALRDRDGVSLVLHCLYNGLKRNLDALLARDEALPLHEAAALGDDAAVAAALERSPAALHLLSPDGWTALHLAAFFGRPSTVTLLLARGADAALWSRAFEHNLPLHAACAGRTEKAEVVRALIAATRDLDARQGGGWTPLMLASANGMAAAVQLLLAAGADWTLANDHGKTALDLAREHGHTAIAERLAHAG
ncbi:MAG: ankyrin repeat domain-containing protein [Proteobacteria bacterium]|nr:ankyrin repeat domain-containing protein [Pseudomonadota bacterium]